MNQVCDIAATDRAESALLSGLLRWPDALDDVSGIVRADQFRTDAHVKLFSILLDMHGRRPIGLLTVADELNSRGQLADVGGGAGLAAIWNIELTGGHTFHHAQIVRDAYLRRSLSFLAGEIARESDSPSQSALEAVEAVERKIWALSEMGTSGQVSDLVPEYNAILDNFNNPKKGIDGLPTGLIDLDKILCGLQPTQLIIVGARPATGKTAFGLSIARHLAVDLGIPIFFASLEQGKRELAERLIAGQACVDGQSIRMGKVFNGEVAKVSKATHDLRPAPLIVDDAACQTVQRIAANARRLHRQRQIKAVIVDYLQLIYPEDRRLKRYEQVGVISRRLKILARELQIPVVALAQLNRGTEEHKEPRLSDLRDSGDIEQDADTVLLMHKPPSKADAPPNDVIEIQVAKHRNGPTGRVSVIFDRPTMRFLNMASPKW